MSVRFRSIGSGADVREAGGEPREHERVGLLSAVGALLELVGLVVALVGVQELSAELFPSRPLPHRAAWSWIRRYVGSKGQPVNLQISGSLSALRVTGDVRLSVIKARPSEDAPLAEWNAYWDSRLAELRERIDLVAEDRREADEEIRDRLTQESSDRKEENRRLESRLRAVVGGEEGSGLVKTWWGLVVTAVGVALQGVASLS